MAYLKYIYLITEQGCSNMRSIGLLIVNVEYQKIIFKTQKQMPNSKKTTIY